MAYMEAIKVPINVQDDVIMGLTTLFRNGASVRDEVGAPESEPVREDPPPPPHQEQAGPQSTPVTAYSPRVELEA